MTGDERIEAVRKLGYSRRESAFLALVALNGGFFLVRHFREFTGLRGGQTTIAFTNKLRARGHARVTILTLGARLLHLASNLLYAALDEPPPHHSSRSAPAIRTRLLVLDYIIAHRQYQYLATERERVDYFTSQHAVAEACLPKKVYRLPGRTSVTTRYFVDRSPIALVPSADGEPTRIAFCYVELSARFGRGFKEYLNQYRAVIEAVENARVVYVAAHDWNFQRARAAFERVWPGDQPTERPRDPRIGALLRHFKIRARYEAGAFGELTAADLQELRRGRDLFVQPDLDDLFERWKRDGDGTVASELHHEAALERKGCIAFSTWCPPPRRDPFGDLWSRPRPAGRGWEP